MKKNLLAIALLLLCSSQVLAESSIQLLTKLQKNYPNLKIEVLRQLPLDEFKNFYEVSFNGKIFIVHKNGEYAIAGNLIEIKTNNDLTAAYQLKLKTALAEEIIPKLSDKTFITYTPKNKKIGTVYFFVDITFGHKRELYNTIDGFMKRKIEVKFMPYPMYGMNPTSRGYQKLQQIMCSKDIKKTFEALIKNPSDNNYHQKIYPKECTAILNKGIEAVDKIKNDDSNLIYISNCNSFSSISLQDLYNLENVLKKMNDN
jgi:thiol:disulfide interchange protein DsbC